MYTSANSIVLQIEGLVYVIPQGFGNFDVLFKTQLSSF